MPKSKYIVTIELFFLLVIVLVSTCRGLEMWQMGRLGWVSEWVRMGGVRVAARALHLTPARSVGPCWAATVDWLMCCNHNLRVTGS